MREVSHYQKVLQIVLQKTMFSLRDMINIFSKKSTDFPTQPVTFK